MDMTPAILIFTLIFLAVVQQLGVHPVHFGICCRFFAAMVLVLLLVTYLPVLSLIVPKVFGFCAYDKADENVGGGPPAGPSL